MRAHLALAACAATVTLSPSSDQGGHDLLSGQGDTVDPAEAEAEAEAQAASEAVVAKPAKPARSAKTPKSAQVPGEDATASHTAMIWVQPGHERFAIGELIWATDADAEGLRAAGRAREATPEELKARVG